MAHKFLVFASVVINGFYNELQSVIALPTHLLLLSFADGVFMEVTDTLYKPCTSACDLFNSLPLRHTFAQATVAFGTNHKASDMTSLAFHLTWVHTYL